MATFTAFNNTRFPTMLEHNIEDAGATDRGYTVVTDGSRLLLSAPSTRAITTTPTDYLLRVGFNVPKGWKLKIIPYHYASPAVMHFTELIIPSLLGGIQGILIKNATNAVQIDRGQTFAEILLIRDNEVGITRVGGP